MEDRLPRKLAVIVHADVVGSTLLVQRDERLAHDRIQAAFRRFSEFIEAYAGTSYELRGDALVAGFDRASDAVSAALAFHAANMMHNERLSDDVRPELRVGISLGEVVVADQTVTGAGVVLAQRLEQLADPGGVCVSTAIHEALPRRLPLVYVNLGEQMFKGFEEPMGAFAVTLRPGESSSEPERAAAPGIDAEQKVARAVAGRPDVAVLVVPAAWVLYIAIVFEILFMVSPFAFYYYAAYGPSLNLLHLWPWTAWLTDFILPHFSYTPNVALSLLHDLGEPLIIVGFVLFAAGFLQVYSAKVRNRGLITGGLYVAARHPQYLALALVGLGAFLVWPRVLVLLMYVTMLFLYRLLARWEEAQCLEKFGDEYRTYQRRTGMFLPRPFPRVVPWPQSGPATLPFYGLACIAALAVGYGLRSYSLDQVSAFYTEDMAVLSPAVLDEDTLRQAVRVATSAPDVQEPIAAAGGKLLVYVLPADWKIADLPLDPPSPQGDPETERGHFTPRDFDPRHYRVLFTRVRTHDRSAKGRQIVTKAYGRDPLLVVRVDTGSGKVTSVGTPPAHVRWGDISTPMF